MLSHDEIIAGLIVIQLFFGGTVFVYAVFKQQGEQSNPRRYTEAEQQKLITELWKMHHFKSQVYRNTW